MSSVRFVLDTTSYMVRGRCGFESRCVHMFSFFLLVAKYWGRLDESEFFLVGWE